MKALTLSIVLLSTPLGLAQFAGAQSESESLIEEVEAAIVSQTNDFRQQHELDAVERDEDLMSAAKQFAEYMARTDKYGHRADGNTPAERAEAAGYNYCVVRENIAYRTNTGSVTAASLIDVFVQGWIDSPPHRENMLADYVTETGVGVATTDDVTYFAVQLFGRPESKSLQIKIRNESGEMQRVRFRANDQSDQIELPPRMIVTMTRCFPTTVSLLGSESSASNEEEIRIDDSALLTVTDQGIKKSTLKE